MITGQVKNHQHNKLLPVTIGQFNSEFNWQDHNAMPENSVIKLPDGTMIQTTCVRFNLRKTKGYTHNRDYIAIWREQFIKRPVILAQHYVDVNAAGDATNISINYQKSTNTEVVFRIWDTGSEQRDKMIIFVGLGRWK